MHTHMLCSVCISVWDRVVSCSCIFEYTSDIVQPLECRPYTHMVTCVSIHITQLCVHLHHSVMCPCTTWRRWATLVTTEVNFVHSPLNIIGSTFVCTWFAFTSHRVMVSKSLEHRHHHVTLTHQLSCMLQFGFVDDYACMHISFFGIAFEILTWSNVWSCVWRFF